MAEGKINDEIDKPKVLYRAFTVDPRTLTSDFFDKPLIPGGVSKEDSTKVRDGNELGVYMSTNRTMVEAAYAHTNVPGIGIEVPRYKSRDGMVSFVKLPQCGVVVEINTNDLDIRKPQIAEYLKGHYNNGFQGDEWIVDLVPVKNFKVKKLILSRWANDSERVEVNVNQDLPKEEALKLAIAKIRSSFGDKERDAKEFAVFLGELGDEQRKNGYVINKLWLQRQQNKSK